jgi:hypothetical protein
MKKYNTPEIMISMFNKEEVVTGETNLSAQIIQTETNAGKMVVQINAKEIGIEW